MRPGCPEVTKQSTVGRIEKGGIMADFLEGVWFVLWCWWNDICPYHRIDKVREYASMDDVFCRVCKDERTVKDAARKIENLERAKKWRME